MIDLIAIDGSPINTESTISVFTHRNLVLVKLVVEDCSDLGEDSKLKIKSLIESGDLADIEVIYDDGGVVGFRSGVVSTATGSGIILRPVGLIEFNQDDLIF